MKRFELGKIYIACSGQKCEVIKINNNNITFKIPGYGTKRTKFFEHNGCERVNIAISSCYKTQIKAETLAR